MQQAKKFFPNKCLLHTSYLYAHIFILAYMRKLYKYHVSVYVAKNSYNQGAARTIRKYSRYL